MGASVTWRPSTLPRRYSCLRRDRAGQQVGAPSATSNGASWVDNTPLQWPPHTYGDDTRAARSPTKANSANARWDSSTGWDHTTTRIRISTPNPNLQGDQHHQHQFPPPPTSASPAASSTATAPTALTRGVGAPTLVDRQEGGPGGSRRQQGQQLERVVRHQRLAVVQVRRHQHPLAPDGPTCRRSVVAVHRSPDAAQLWCPPGMGWDRFYGRHSLRRTLCMECHN